MIIKNWKLYLESKISAEDQKKKLKKVMENLQDSLVELTDWRECIFSDNDYNKAYIPQINIFIRLQEDASEDEGYLINNSGGVADLLEVDFNKFESEELIKTIKLIKEGLVRSQIEYKNACFYLGSERWSEYVLGDDDGEDEMCSIVDVKIEF